MEFNKMTLEELNDYASKLMTEIRSTELDLKYKREIKFCDFQHTNNSVLYNKATLLHSKIFYKLIQSQIAPTEEKLKILQEKVEELEIYIKKMI